jgi:tRNA-splicing endonuclease subunit Sen34
MSESPYSVSEPIPISLIGGRYLLFDINVVTYLRRTHNICGVLTGSIPQAPQQNIFLGLPVELMPEEAKLLVEKEIAYIVDDTAWHKEKFNTFEGLDRKKYLESLRSQGLQAKRTAETVSRKRSEKALAKLAVTRAQQAATPVDGSMGKDTPSRPEDDPAESLFDGIPVSIERPSSPASSTSSTISGVFGITPTTTYSPSSLPQNPSQQSDPSVPSSYPLFAHLHSRGYFVMPGLRFGGDYNVYPGDPLRFHSHFIAVGLEWNQDIPLLDLIGGGRLGTAVKKGYLIGGENTDTKTKDDNVRTFTLEWGGM